MSEMQFPINLNTKSGLDAFFNAIDNPADRAAINTASLGPGPKQVIEMVNDPEFTGVAVPLGKKILAHRRAVAIGQATPSVEFTNEVKSEAQQLADLITTKYPDGMALLKQYGALQEPILMAGDTSATVSAVANVGAVVNAAVYANVAAATSVVVAAAAVVVVGAFVF